MYSPRLFKYRDSYVLYKPTVHTFGTVSLHTLFWYWHTHMTFPPPAQHTQIAPPPLQAPGAYLEFACLEEEELEYKNIW